MMTAVRRFRWFGIPFFAVWTLMPVRFRHGFVYSYLITCVLIVRYWHAPLPFFWIIVVVCIFSCRPAALLPFCWTFRFCSCAIILIPFWWVDAVPLTVLRYQSPFVARLYPRLRCDISLVRVYVVDADWFYYSERLTFRLRLAFLVASLRS